VAHSPSLPVFIQLVFLAGAQSAHVGSSLADFSNLKMEAIHAIETSVHTRTTRRHILENGILHSHHHENLESYPACVMFEVYILYAVILCGIYGYSMVAEGGLFVDSVVFLFWWHL
jgi:hypothetical protein